MRFDYITAYKRERLSFLSDNLSIPVHTSREADRFYTNTPHRISLRLTARLLRLPLKGGVVGGEASPFVIPKGGVRVRGLRPGGND